MKMMHQIGRNHPPTYLGELRNQEKIVVTSNHLQLKVLTDKQTCFHDQNYRLLDVIKKFTYLPNWFDEDLTCFLDYSFTILIFATYRISVSNL